MYGFTPLSIRSAEEWRATAIEAEGICEIGDFSPPSVLTPDAWIIQAWSHDADDGLDTFLSLPSAADMLLWLRFYVLPNLCRFAADVDLATAAMKQIDEAPDGSNAGELLRRVVSQVSRNQGVYLLAGLQTVHAWLSEQGSVAQFRQTFGDPQIFVVNGFWHMRQATWDAVWANCVSRGREFLSLESVEEKTDTTHISV